jgi:hemerythrin superfamily protein
MLMQIGQNPEHDFSEPIGLLEDCHKRILYFMQTLVTLAESDASTPLGSEDRNSLERALFYFRTAGPRHNADEEESLFPQMRSHSDAQNAPVFARLETLAADHRWVETQHSEIDTIGSRWLSDGILQSSDHSRLRSLVHGLARFYADHIEIEEKQVFPEARRILSSAEKIIVGRKMAKRRGITWPQGLDAAK